MHHASAAAGALGGPYVPAGRALNAGDAVSLTHAMERVVAGPCCPPPCSSSAAAAGRCVAGPVQLVRWRTSWLSVGNTIQQSGHLICAGRGASAPQKATKGRHGLKIKRALPPDQPRFVWPLLQHLPLHAPFAHPRASVASPGPACAARKHVYNTFKTPKALNH